MKSYLKNSIISQAISLGFDFGLVEIDDSVNDLNNNLIDFFNENSDKLPQIEDECEVHNNRRSQNVTYGDFWSDGEIVDFSKHWHKSPDTKIFHSNFVMEDNDGLLKCMNLFYLVGKTDYNSSTYEEE